MKGNSMINVKQAPPEESTLTANVNFVNTTINDSNIMITTH